MAIIQGVIHELHPYVELYRQAFEIMRDKPAEEQTTVAMRLHAERNQDLRRYNLPAANNEVAVIIPGDGSEERSDHHDIILSVTFRITCQLRLRLRPYSDAAAGI